MSDTSPHIVVLGPQRPDPNLRAALDHAGVKGQVSLISAGWRYDEDEVQAARRAIGRPVRHLRLYAWFEEVMAAEPELAAAYKQRQTRIRAYKKAYQLRLRAALQAYEDLFVLAATDPELYAPELALAIDAVKALDTQAADRVRAIHQDFEDAARPWERPAARAYHEQMAQALESDQALAIAGGQVAVLLNRMRFFGLDVLLPRFLDSGKPIFCWSAGAMALCERVVLFYDEPPEGPGDPEVLDRGLGLIPGTLLFPHANLRLRLDLPDRVHRLRSRFAPRRCVALEHGAWQVLRGGRWTDRGAPGSSFELGVDAASEGTA